MPFLNSRLASLLFAKVVRSYLSSISRRAADQSYPDLAIHARDYISADIMLYGYWEIDELNSILFL